MTLKNVSDIIEERANETNRELRESWEQVRWLAAVGLQPHAKKGTTIKPTDLIKFDWDNQTKQTKKPTSDIKERWAKWDAEMAKRYGK